ncbi:uncharacterized protein LOC122672089 [Telopea speciosissima]|uniref:uncharacterized protein LOC122672089 n=1 Tax=Telopea speciosissima TaxID=54955 RepID=UPI001CC42880|nr:uncharacterized protein LOC122672089 [Telopea speciosissima]
MDLKDRLLRLSKGTSTISKFLLEARSIADALAATDNPVANEDLILAVLRGLGDEYKDFATSVPLRTDSVTFLDLSGLLLSQEFYLSSTAAIATAPILTANAAATGSDRSRSHYRGNRRSQYYSSQGRRQFSDGRSAGFDQNHSQSSLNYRGHYNNSDRSRRSGQQRYYTSSQPSSPTQNSYQPAGDSPSFMNTP